MTQVKPTPALVPITHLVPEPPDSMEERVDARLKERVDSATE